MIIKRCGTCNGLKKIKGLGLIMKDCRDCKGNGFVSEKAVETMSDEVEKTVKVVVNASKKRGRPRMNEVL